MLGALMLTAIVTSNEPTTSRLIKVGRSTTFPASGQAVKLYSNINPGFSFNEVIPSWNLDNSQNGGVRVEIGIKHKGTINWYNLGEWSGDNGFMPRKSQKGQSDSAVSVLTDTLRLKIRVPSVDVRVTMFTKSGTTRKNLASLKLLTLNFSDTTKTTVKSKWDFQGPRGVLVDVPERAQGNYPNGSVLCSATSTSMILWYWSRALQRPELDKDVPEVESLIWDPVYDGAGNWPFNTALVGSVSGFRAAVSRLTDIRDLEELTAAGLPVACSVSFDYLRGKPLSPTPTGHLVLCVGFEPDGTPIINDPAFKNGVRKTYPRADFEKAWCYSHRTVYLMVPDSLKLPKDSRRIWGIQ